MSRVVSASGERGEFVRWEMPLAQAWQFYNCYQVANGIDTVWSHEAAARRREFAEKLDRLTKNTGIE